MMKSAVQSVVNQLCLHKDEAEYLRNIVRILGRKASCKGLPKVKKYFKMLTAHRLQTILSVW